MSKDDKKKPELKLDFKNLPELKSTTYNLPKPPPVSLGKKKDEEALQDLKDRKPFSLRDQYDLNTYQGRFRHQFSRINPLLFFVSEPTILECKEKVEKHRLREEASRQINAPVLLKEKEIEELVYADKVVGSSLHPDTGKIIPFYQRMSGFVIFNVPLVFAVLFTKNQTPAFNATFQGINQTYNASMNYGNRNATSPYTIADMGKGYFAATAVSVLIALYTRKAFASTLKPLSGYSLTFANSSLNYLAGALAGASNLALMRYREMQEGIKVYSKEGDEEYGSSKVAAKKAIGQTAFSRFLLPLPVLFFPAFAQLLFTKLRIWPRNTYATKFLELSFCAIALTVALPMSVALFQQRGMITRDEVDEDIREATKDKNVQEFYFNKGL
ncbi:hypothetical protein FGO68_gene16303 [Halteria grandinella]|uniref:Uncharacterized protein n=1 Tax=Halteria grandinella TaxID=5974 RepID=A0A8J8T9L6_HALGN|nr:hypothetical protein FGO68_gene16303 [Halteria grandinella]